MDLLPADLAVCRAAVPLLAGSLAAMIAINVALLLLLWRRCPCRPAAGYWPAGNAVDDGIHGDVPRVPGNVRARRPAAHPAGPVPFIGEVGR